MPTEGIGNKILKGKPFWIMNIWRDRKFTLKKQISISSKKKENVTTITFRFDKEGLKKLETVTINSVFEETVSKEITTCLSVDNTSKNVIDINYKSESLLE